MLKKHFVGPLFSTGDFKGYEKGPDEVLSARPCLLVSTGNVWKDNSR
jgi:hypothetical protein